MEYVYFCRRLEAQRKKERTEAHLYMSVQVVTEDNYAGHQGNDLFDLDRCQFRVFKVKKTATLMEFMETVAETMVIILPPDSKLYVQVVCSLNT